MGAQRSSTKKTFHFVQSKLERKGSICMTSGLVGLSKEERDSVELWSHPRTRPFSRQMLGPGKRTLLSEVSQGVQDTQKHHMVIH